MPTSRQIGLCVFFLIFAAQCVVATLWCVDKARADEFDPPKALYVAPDGIDQAGGGTEAAPLQTIAYAMLVASDTDDASTILHLAAGLYEEQVTFAPKVHLYGAGPEHTIIKSDAIPVVVAADQSKLANLTVTLPELSQHVVTLLDISGVTMEVDGVVLDGAHNPHSTGVQVSGAGSSASTIHNSCLQNLDTGVRALESGVTLARNVFQTIFSNGVFVVRPEQEKSLDNGEAPMLGYRRDILATGLNRFYDVEGRFINHLGDSTLLAEFNDWGAYTFEELEDEFSDNTVFAPWFGSSLAQASVVVEVRDVYGYQLSQYWDPVVTADKFGKSLRKCKRKALSDGFRVEAVWDENTGLFVLDNLSPGVWTVAASSPWSYVDALAEVEVVEGQVAAVVVALDLEGECEGEGECESEEPVAAIEAAPLRGEAPLTVQFDTTSGGDDDPYYAPTFFWDFDDDGVYENHDTSPSHTYTEPGVYTVRFGVYNCAGYDERTWTDYITVLAQDAPLEGEAEGEGGGEGEGEGEGDAKEPPSISIQCYAGPTTLPLAGPAWGDVAMVLTAIGLLLRLRWKSSDL